MKNPFQQAILASAASLRRSSGPSRNFVDAQSTIRSAKTASFALLASRRLARLSA